MFNPRQIKSDFPILARKINGHPLAYLDNGATSQKPLQVINAISDYYRSSNANIHRGVHTLAEESTQAYEDSRKTVASFIKAQPEEIIFTRNTTESLNLIAYSWGLNNLKKGDEIIVSIMEHHSNLVPWQLVAQKTGAVLKFLNHNQEGEIKLSSPVENKDGSQIGGLKELLSDRTKIVSLVHVSNALGTINPLQEIFKLVKKHNSETTCIADGAQSVPHMPVDVTELKADFLAFSGHKMCGPMGIGVLWAKKSLLEKMPPFLAGGDMIAEVYLDHSTYNQVPQKFEAGTPNVAGAVGLKAACDYLATIGMENIHAQEQKLVQYAYEKLTHFPQIKILGPKDFSKRSGIITFEYLGVHAHDVAQILNSVGVAVRSGHHCTMPLHKSINLAASTRISTYFYNTREDIDQVITGLKKVQKIFKL